MNGRLGRSEGSAPYDIFYYLGLFCRITYKLRGKEQEFKIVYIFLLFKKIIIFTTDCQINYGIQNYRLSSVGKT
jgi:hypothetical protein